MLKNTKSRGYTYSLTKSGFEIVNGRKYFNRPLYGTHTRDKDSIDDSVLVVAGDIPQVMSILLHAQQGAKGGILSFGVIVGEESKWLHEFDWIKATYDPGLMRYILTDQILKKSEIYLDVVPLSDTEGFIAQFRLKTLKEPATFVWSYGGLTAFGASGSHMDYGSLGQEVFNPKEYSGNMFEVENSVFRLNAPKKNPGKVFQGICSFKGIYRIADARMLPKGPKALLSSKGKEYPILVHSSDISKFPFVGYIVVLREVRNKFQVKNYLVKPEETFSQCVKYYKGISQRVILETPDKYLNKGMEALCLAMDACWHYPTFMHGPWSWHEPYLGWRGWYGAEAMGWHDRVEIAIRAHGATQIKKPESTKVKWTGPDGYAYGGNSRGGVPSMLNHPGVFYNMTEVYLDHILYHYQWTGNLDFAREIFPIIQDALAWEQHTFDADNDGLYENWLNTWISDAHWYNGGACIQSSAYNYRANLMASKIAKRLGIDSMPFRKQAKKIKEAINKILWLPKKGIYAEYKDVIGLKRLHESPELASIYHPIDFYLTDEFQAYQMLRFTEYGLKNEYKTPGGGRLIWSSAWVPPLYSSCGLYPQEILNTLLCYYRIGQVKKAQELLNGCVASWYMGPTPGGIAHNIKPDGEHFGSTDFTDTVSMFARVIIEGLFGILPEMQNNMVTIMPGFPLEWVWAKIHTPDITYEYKREGLKEKIRITTVKPTKKVLKMIAKWDGIQDVQIDGQPVDFEIIPGIGHAYISVKAPLFKTAEFLILYRRTPLTGIAFSPIAAFGEQYYVQTKQGQMVEVSDPQGVFGEYQLRENNLRGKVKASLGYHTFFILLKNEDIAYWKPVDIEVRQPLEVIQPKLDLSNSKAVYSFKIRNNLSRSLQTDFIVHFANNEILDKVELKAYSISKLFTYPMNNLYALTPGQNPLEVIFRGYPFTASSVITLWNLLEKLPEITKQMQFYPIVLNEYYNDYLEKIHCHEFRSPRPSTYSIMTKLDGRPIWDGNLWGYGKPAIIDDSNLRGRVNKDGQYITKVGIPFRGKIYGKNVVVVSIWDNFPISITIPVNKKARKLYLLVIGSTHPMQSHIANGEIIVHYEDRKKQTLDLINPQNFDDLITAPYHLEGATEIIGNNTHAIVLDMVLSSSKTIRKLEIRALSNEVIIGLLGLTFLI